MNYYENAVILSDTLPEEDLRSAIDKIKGVMQDAGGQVIKVDEWGIKKLAYELNRHKKGFYAFFLLKAPAEAIKRLEEFYKVYDPVIKFMVIRLEKNQIKAVEAALQSEAATAAAEQPAPATEQPVAEQSSPETSIEQPLVKQAAAEHPLVEQAAGEQPLVGQPAPPEAKE